MSQRPCGILAQGRIRELELYRGEGKCYHDYKGLFLHTENTGAWNDLATKYQANLYLQAKLTKEKIEELKTKLRMPRRYHLQHCCLAHRALICFFFGQTKMGRPHHTWWARQDGARCFSGMAPQPCRVIPRSFCFLFLLSFIHAHTTHNIRFYFILICMFLDWNKKKTLYSHRSSVISRCGGSCGAWPSAATSSCR